MIATPVEVLARRDRIAVLAALGLVVAMSLVLLQSANLALMALDPVAVGWLAFPTLLFVMWWTMMLAMMLPSAAPAILMFAAMSRRVAGGRGASQFLCFVAGYAAVWTAFSLAATAMHLLVAATDAMTAMMAVTGRALGGLLLIAAGLYQLTPLKFSCLSRCQAPLMYFARNWRPGAAGALRMGMGHGLYCLGCCAVLMAVLFYGGIMEPLWIGGLALYILIEKLLPARWGLARFTGLLLVAWGGGVFFHAF